MVPSVAIKPLTIPSLVERTKGTDLAVESKLSLPLRAKVELASNFKLICSVFASALLGCGLAKRMLPWPIGWALN